jgi:hypothetical protein
MSSVRWISDTVWSCGLFWYAANLYRR